MPHYADGSEARVGDLVKGKGYNVPHEIIGRVVNVRPGESCTLSVAFVGARTPILFRHEPGAPAGNDHTRPFAVCHVVAEVEYGDTRCFEKIG